MARFEIVVELLSEPRRDLRAHLRGLDRGPEPSVHGEEHAELGEVGLDRRLHIRILQLRGKRTPIET